MVASYDIGNPARSFVRIPGSGSDPSLKSVCCDLSRGNTAAASVPIPQNISQLPLMHGPSSTKVKDEGANNGKHQKKSEIKIPIPQLPSVACQPRAQVTLTESVETMNNQLQGNQSDQMKVRKPPQIILPSKVIKVNTGKTISQSLPPRTRFNITTNNKRMIRQPTINSIKKAVNRRSPTRSVNFKKVTPNSQHSGGVPESEQDGKLLERQKRIQQHRLFQEIFKDKKRLTALLKRLNVIR